MAISPFLNITGWCQSIEDMRKTLWDPGVFWFWFIYMIYFPIMATIAVVGNILCLRVILRLAKGNPVFYLQSVVMTTDILVILTFMILAVNQLFGLTWNRGSDEAQAVWFLSWWAAFTTYVPINICITSDVLLVLATGFYKLYAMKYPFKFKQLNHKKVAIIVTLSSFAVGFTTCIQEMIRPSVHYCEDYGRYYLFYETNLSRPLQLMAYTRFTVRVVGTLSLAVVSIWVGKIYRKLQKTATRSENETQAQRQEAIDSKLLTTLLLVQAVTLIIGLIGLYMWYLSIYALGVLPPAWFAGLIDFLCATSFVMNSVCYISMSKDFRKKLRNSIPCLKNPNAVVPFEQDETNITRNRTRTRNTTSQRMYE